MRGRWRRFRAWLREAHQDAARLEAERVRYRDQGEMQHHGDKAEVSEWGHLG